MNITYESRTIRIFISSTFEDMKEERDYLITKIFPKLAAEATKRDVTLIPLDLRWGISEEESRTGKVIEICLQEIEQSRPFFIGLLGNRYGWCPPKEELQKNTALQERYNWVEADISEGLSVTEMEIQYGALRNPEKIDAFFYIRNDGQAEGENAEKLKRLKNEVRNNRRYPVSEYRTVEELGSEVEAAFTQLLNERFPNCQLTNLEKERLAQLAFLHNRCEAYIPQEEALAALDNFLKDDNAHNLVVTGESGIGKSALIANWLAPLIRKDGLKVIYHFVGNGEAEGNYQHIVQRISEEIRDSYHLPQDDNWGMDKKKPEEALQSLYGMIAGKEPLLLVLDGINQLADEDNAKQLLWLPQATRNIKYLFSTLPDDKTMAVFTNRKYPIFTLHPLHKAQQRELVNLYLRRYGKKLTQEQVDRIIHNPQNKNTLVLRTLLDELIGFGSYEQLDKRIDYYLKSDSIEDFFQRVLQRFEEDFTEPQVRHLLSLIAFSRNGLSEQEIMDIAGITPYHWSQFYCAFRTHLTSQSGLQTFSHQYMAKAVQTRYTNWATNAMHDIVQYFKDIQSKRAWDELSYLYYELEELEALYHLLLNLDVTNYLFVKDRYELSKYWRILLETDEKKFTPEAYLNLPGDEGTQSACYTNLGNLFANEIINPHLSLLFYQRTVDLYQSLNGKNNYTLSLFEKYIGYVYSIQEDHDKALHYYLKAIEILGPSANNDKHLIECYNNIGYVYSAQGKYDQALEYLEKALNISKKINGSEHPDTALYFNNIGSIYYSLKQFSQALSYHKKALEIRKTILGETNVDVAASYNNIGTIYNDLGEYDKALECYACVLNICIPLLGENHLQVATCYNNMGLSYDYKGDYDKGLAYFQKSLAIAQQLFGERHTQVALCYNNIGYICQLRRQYQEALAYYEKALNIYTTISGSNHPNVALCYNNIGMVYWSIGNYDKAVEYYLKAVEIYKVRLGERQPDVARCYNNLGTVYNAIKDYETAGIYYENALDIYLTNYGEKHIDVANCYANMGYNYTARHEHDNALEYCKKAQEIYENFGEKSANVAACYNSMGLTYFYKKEYSKALEYYKKAIDMFHTIHLDTQPNTAVCYLNMGQATLLLGQEEEAATYFKKSQEINIAVFGKEHPTVATFDNYIKQIYASATNKKQHNSTIRSLFKKLFKG